MNMYFLYERGVCYTLLKALFGLFCLCDVNFQITYRGILIFINAIRRHTPGREHSGAGEDEGEPPWDGRSWVKSRDPNCTCVLRISSFTPNQTSQIVRLHL